MTIDWRDVRRRVEAAMAATDVAASGEEDAWRTLEARAVALARAPEEGGDQDAEAIVELTIAGRACAVEASCVIAVLRAPTVTPIPGAPATLLGIARVRGTILAVFDAGLPLFDRPSRQGPEARVLALGGGHPPLGIFVDSVDRVSMTPASVVAAPSGNADGLVRGVGIDGRMLLSGAALLADRRFFVDAARSAQGD